MKHKSTLLLLVVFMLCFALSAPAWADDTVVNDESRFVFADNEPDRASNYLSMYSVGMTAQGGRTMKVSFSVRATRVMNKVGVTQIIIERNNGNGWVHDRTLYYTSYSNFLRYNAIQNMSSVTFTGVSGYKYRACITAHAADSSGFDYKMAYSGSDTCY